MSERIPGSSIVGVEELLTADADDELNLYGWMAKLRWPWTTEIVGAHSYPLSGRVVFARLNEEGM